MKYYFAALLAAAAIVTGAAETISDYLPECAIDCLNTAIGDVTTCSGPEDLECFCIADNYRAIYTSGVSCVLQACGNDVSVGEVLPAAARMCEIVVERSGAPVTSVGFPSSTSSTAPAAGQNTAPADPPSSTTTDAPDSGAMGLSAGMLVVAAPFAFAALASL
ncbi:hypothetical protein MFIFM68171_03925 [Madurella fahalii]|uniref:CFEM domain-containing protein n=1 Tax=Madurella fahalii TaxID=1157608 RepID=A0ABQ0G7I5_9PEZI